MELFALFCYEFDVWQIFVAVSFADAKKDASILTHPHFFVLVLFLIFGIRSVR